eukprot:8216060-Alexandrium_andersonii.AAC.1
MLALLGSIGSIRYSFRSVLGVRVIEYVPGNAQIVWESTAGVNVLDTESQLASRAPIVAKDCADCGLEDCGLELASPRFRALGPPRRLLSWADSESARNTAQNTPLA